MGEEEATEDMPPTLFAEGVLEENAQDDDSEQPEDPERHSKFSIKHLQIVTLIVTDSRQTPQSQQGIIELAHLCGFSLFRLKIFRRCSILIYI